MPNYEQGKIYAIRSHLTDEIYIGSTTQSLSQRFGGHKRSKDTTSVKLLSLGDAYIELIENYPCKNKEELNRREGQLQREHLEKIVNRKIEGRSKAEYWKENKEKFASQKAVYRAENKEEIVEKKAEYYQENKEKISEKMATYYQANKEKIAAYNQANKEKKKQQQRDRRMKKKLENPI